MTIAAEPAAPETTPLASALRERHVAMIALGGVIGAGLFVGSSAAILAAGPAVLASYAIAGAIVFLTMRMLGEMAVARPGLGSFNAYIRAALGRRAAFVSAWLYWYFWIIAVGAETIAGAALLHDWIAAPVWLIGLVLIALLTATNLLSVKAYGEFEYWFSLIKVLAILAFILIAAAHLGLIVAHGASPLATLVGSGGVAPKGFAAVLGAVPTVIFSLTGSEIASIAAAESDDPPGNVARASRTVALRITIFYLAAILLVVATVPWSSLQSGQSPFVAAMRAIGVPGAAVLMQAIILVAVLSCLNSGLYVCSRTLFELADAGDAPRALVAVGANKVPVRATLMGSAAGFLAAIASVLSPGLVFAFLLATSGAVILVVYILVALAQIADRRRRDAAGETPAFPMWGFPWLSVAAIGGIAAIFVTMAVLPEARGQLLAGAGSVVVVAVAAWWRGRRVAAA